MENDLKSGSTIIIIGRVKSGKTPWTKQFCYESNFKTNIVYDRRKEYELNKFTVFYSLLYFREYIKTRQNSFIIVEEATGFIAAYKEQQWSDFIVGIEHNRNILCLLFHSLADTPPYILRNSQFVILFPTNDEPKDVESSRSKLFPAFEKMRTKPKNSKGWNEPELLDYNNL